MAQQITDAKNVEKYLIRPNLRLYPKIELSGMGIVIQLISILDIIHFGNIFEVSGGGEKHHLQLIWVCFDKYQVSINDPTLPSNLPHRSDRVNNGMLC